MKKSLVFACFALCVSAVPARGAGSFLPSDWIDPFIGTALEGNAHTTPGACVPFGMVMAAPMTGRNAWRYCSGYLKDDLQFYGFAQNALSGTGCGDLGDVLITPVAGEPPTIGDVPAFRLTKIPASEKASAGSYAVAFENGVAVEATASERTTYYRIDYGAATNAQLAVDLQWGIADSYLRRVKACRTEWADGAFCGEMDVSGWTDRHVAFAMRFSAPVVWKRELPKAAPSAKGERWLFGFGKPAGPVFVRVALSTVSPRMALVNLDVETTGRSFETTRKAARDTWNGYLDRIVVEGSDEDRKKFYTAFYHTEIQPNNVADVDGTYRDARGHVVNSTCGRCYSTLSLWDTYRAVHPLYTLTAPERVRDFVNSMLDQYDTLGHLPMWGLWGKDTLCMLGVHAVPVIVDAWAKGIGDFDVKRAYAAIRDTQRITHTEPAGSRDRYFHLRDDWEILDKYGWYPTDIVKAESVSRVLENGYDDWCAAKMAEGLGETADAAFFAKRARAYRNIFDPSTGFMRGRDSKGAWRTPFDPVALGHSAVGCCDYTEGNAWQWTWHVLQDPQDLVRLMGGKAAFTKKLEALFVQPDVKKGADWVEDVSGLVGQYAHGNEPCHHVLYLFNLTDNPRRGQELIRQISKTFYRNAPDGLCGNEDCGQMSAWYVFSALGFYPVSPASGEYWLGAPQVPKATIRLANGKAFTVVAKNLSEANKYVRAVTLNGKPMTGFILRHADILAGGELVFEMTAGDSL